jgi:cathepsin L
LKDIVGSVGPVSIVLCDDANFQLYGGGLFDEPNCCTALAHAPVIVGYGSTPAWGDYWILKNSWGTGWGDNGYMYMARNRGNQCNVAHYAVVNFLVGTSKLNSKFTLNFLFQYAV